MSAVRSPATALSLSEARALQQRLRARVSERDRLGPVLRVAGADVAYDGNEVLHAAIVVLDADSLELLESASVCSKVPFPYVPGYLSFREMPALLAAWAKLRLRPDLLLVDGHGRAHPRRFGIACHLGVELDVPSIGCAKSRLVGLHRTPGTKRGSHVQLRQGAEVIGEVLRTRDASRPIYVSVGHRISLATARRWVLRLSPRSRLPEPLRAAHAEVNRLRFEPASAAKRRAQRGEAERSPSRRP